MANVIVYGWVPGGRIPATTVEVVKDDSLGYGRTRYAVRLDDEPIGWVSSKRVLNTPRPGRRTGRSSTRAVWTAVGLDGEIVVEHSYGTRRDAIVRLFPADRVVLYGTAAPA